MRGLRPGELWLTKPVLVGRIPDREDIQTYECPQIHHGIDKIMVYDRESYDKYKSGEYKRPERCVCGAEIKYEEPFTVLLVEEGKPSGEMILIVPYPLTYVDLKLDQEGDQDAQCDSEEGRAAGDREEEPGCP